MKKKSRFIGKASDLVFTKKPKAKKEETPRQLKSRVKKLLKNG